MLPAPQARALVLLCNPDAELDEFLSVVDGDPGLTATVLRAANSAASAPMVPIGTAQRAAVRLGITALRQIVSTAVLQSRFTRLDEAGLDVGEFWRHALAVGLLAEAAARDEDFPALFTAGLLHDIGRLAMASAGPARYAEAIANARRGVDVEEAERRACGTTHTAWASRLCEAWRLPEAVADAAADHHGGDGEVASAVRRARETAWSLGYGDGMLEPVAVTFDEERSIDAAVVRALGGPAGVAARVRWFRDATVPR